MTKVHGKVNTGTINAGAYISVGPLDISGDNFAGVPHVYISSGNARVNAAVVAKSQTSVTFGFFNVTGAAASAAEHNWWAEDELQEGY